MRLKKQLQPYIALNQIHSRTFPLHSSHFTCSPSSLTNKLFRKIIPVYIYAQKRLITTEVITLKVKLKIDTIYL